MNAFLQFLVEFHFIAGAVSSSGELGMSVVVYLIHSFSPEREHRFVTCSIQLIDYNITCST